MKNTLIIWSALLGIFAIVGLVAFYEFVKFMAWWRVAFG